MTSSRSAKAPASFALFLAFSIGATSGATGCLGPSTTPVEKATEASEVTLAAGATEERLVTYEGSEEVTLRSVLESPVPLDDVLAVEILHADRDDGGRERSCAREESTRTDATGLAQREVVASCRSRAGRARLRLTNLTPESVTFGWRVVASMDLASDDAEGALRLEEEGRGRGRRVR